MTDTDAIKLFVRETLGCACEDSVFRTIRRSRMPVGGRSAVRLEIGGRLLVWVISPVAAGDLKTGLRAWIDQGIAERDAGRLNRFRLVLGASDTSAVEAVARELFAGVVLPDERVHLHVLPLASLDEINRE